MPASQAGRRGFESRLPLQTKDLAAPEKAAFHRIPLTGLPAGHPNDFWFPQYGLFQFLGRHRPVPEGSLGVLLDRHAHTVAPLVSSYFWIQFQTVPDARVGGAHHPEIHPFETVPF